MKTILCYGDSNTWGAAPLTDFPGRGNRFAPGTRWTGVLQAGLSSEYRVIEEGLGGRTTVRSDPVEGEHKNGRTYLLPCLETHQPIDLVILMLGTNDLKQRFSASAFDIALGVGALIEVIQKSTCGPDYSPPQVLVMVPPPIIEVGGLGKMFDGGAEKSAQLRTEYKQIADYYGCACFDTSTIIASSAVDGIHFDESEHHKLGQALVPVLRLLNV